MYAALEYMQAAYRTRHPRRRGMQAEFDHVALSARAPLQLAHFYVDVLHLTPKNVDEFAEGKANFPSVRLNDAAIIDFLQAPKEETVEPPGQFCMCLRKRDFDALVVRLATHGIEPEGPPQMLNGAKGSEWAMYTRDPEGNRVEFRCFP